MRTKVTAVFRPLALLGPAILLISPAAADDWPQWRGPAGDGVSRGANVPLAWSEHFAMAWKTPLPGWGTSTPIVYRDAVFVTSQQNNQAMFLTRVDAATGKVVWSKQVGSQPAPVTPLFRKEGDARRHQKFHNDHNFATPSPVTDGQRVVAHFGNGDLVAFDFDGNELWRRNLQKEHGNYTVWWGHGNTPLLYNGKIISACMQDSCKDLPGKPSESYVIAHDINSGRTLWKTPRPTDAHAEQCDAYTTPIVYRAGNRDQIVVMGGRLLNAYDPKTGKQIWHMPELTGIRCVTGPVTSQGIIYATQGMRKPLLAIKPSGTGELTRKDIVWKLDQGTPDSSSPVVWKDLIFMVDNNGIARCVNALSGRLVWKERLKGKYRASLVAAEGRVYFLNTEGLCSVVSASTRFDRLTENTIDDTTFASPAIANGSIYLRGKKGLYCIRK